MSLLEQILRRLHEEREVERRREGNAWNSAPGFNGKARRRNRRRNKLARASRKRNRR